MIHRHQTNRSTFFIRQVSGWGEFRAGAICGQMCNFFFALQEQAGARWSRRVQGCKACGVQVVLEAFLIDGKLIRSELITPDVIVNKRGPGTKKSSVKGKEAAVAGGRTCERSQAAHL